MNRTVLAIGLASLFSDIAHETATTVLPAYLATMGVAAVWLGLIEGVSDGLSSLGKLASGYYTDRLAHRKPVAVAGYLITALGTAAFGLATQAWHVLLCRATAWLGRGVRTPVRKALLTAEDALCATLVPREHHGMGFGVLATVNGIGDFVSSVLVGLLWTSFGATVAFTYSGALFLAGAVLALRIPGDASATD